MADIRMVGPMPEHRRIDDVGIDTTGPSDEDRWAEFCQTIEARIVLARREEADRICRTCGSTNRSEHIMRICTTCQEEKTLDQFNRAIGKPMGREHRCKNCKNTMNRRLRREAKVKQYRALIGRAS